MVGPGSWEDLTGTLPLIVSAVVFLASGAVLLWVCRAQSVIRMLALVLDVGLDMVLQCGERHFSCLPIESGRHR